MRSLLVILILIFLPLSLMTVGAENWIRNVPGGTIEADRSMPKEWVNPVRDTIKLNPVIEMWVKTHDTTTSYPMIIDGRYEINEHWEPILDDPDYIIAGYRVIYDTTDLWLKAGIDTIECWWEPKIVGYRVDTICTDYRNAIILDQFLRESLKRSGWKIFDYDTTFTYAYPVDSVMCCDTTWTEEKSIYMPDTNFQYFGDSPYNGDSTFVSSDILIRERNKRIWGMKAKEKIFLDSIREESGKRLKRAQEMIINWQLAIDTPCSIWLGVGDYDSSFDTVVLNCRWGEDRARSKIEEMLSVYGPQRPLHLYEPILEFDEDDNIILIIKYKRQGDTEISVDTILQPKSIKWYSSIKEIMDNTNKLFHINPDRYWFLNCLNSRRIDSSKIMHPDAVIVKKLLPDEYEIDSTDVTDWNKGNPKIVEER